MAKGWKSTTNIQYGKDDGELVTFGPGDTVTGLTKEQMAQLWEAGALEETEEADPKPSASSESPTSTGVKSAEGGDTEGKEATPSA